MAAPQVGLSGISHEFTEWTQADTLWEAIHALNWHLEIHTDQGKLPHVEWRLPIGRRQSRSFDFSFVKRTGSQRIAVGERLALYQP